MIEQLLQKAVQVGRPFIEKGEVATYIPELGNADKNKLGICVHTLDGGRFACGDVHDRFSIQSISKVITLAAALELCGFDTGFENVVMEPSGDAFNSLIKLEISGSHPYNPMINSGAIAVASYTQPRISFSNMLALTQQLCHDKGVVLDEKVYHSEMENVARNRAIAYLLESKGVIKGNVEEALDFYVRMCSLSVTAEGLANLGLLLANDGVDPNGGGRLLANGVEGATTSFPAYASLNAQITRWFRHFSIYVGGENLTNYKQRNPILHAEHPWSDKFDATQVWGPVHGAMAYAGVRINY